MPETSEQISPTKASTEQAELLPEKWAKPEGRIQPLVCPFCGSLPKVVAGVIGLKCKHGDVAKCVTDGCPAYPKWTDIEVWNTRTVSPTTEQVELVEQLAALAHQQWSGWMRYIFEKSKIDNDGWCAISPDLVLRWQRQVTTPYADLPEYEKESDRVEARKALALFASTLTAERIKALEDALKIVETKWATVSVGKVSPENQAEYERFAIAEAIRALIGTPASAAPID